MAKKDDQVSLSPPVLQVITDFVARMRTDDGIEDDAIDRLETLLKKPVVPKIEEISAALFSPSLEGKP